jgi:nicotinic acid phosphoribosyltransferase
MWLAPRPNSWNLARGEPLVPKGRCGPPGRDRGGLDSTSNVLAALQLGQTPTGTMAHALVMAIAALEGSETDAFAAFHRYFPGAPLLIDTFDTVAAARHLAQQRQQGQASPSGGSTRFR